MEDAYDGIRDNDTTFPVDSTEIVLPRDPTAGFFKYKSLMKKVPEKKNRSILERIAYHVATKTDIKFLKPIVFQFRYI